MAPARVLLLLAILSLAPPSAAGELKLTTWNLNWLIASDATRVHPPPGVRLRTAEDFDRLRAYALELDADVIAIEEVEGPAAAYRVFPQDRYAVHMSHDRVLQRVGLVVRRMIPHHRHPDVPLAPPETEARLRAGVDVSLDTTPPLRLLAVHLKQGCRDPRADRGGARDCVLLQAQVPPLAAWIAERGREGVGFAVMGDFNRWMDRRDGLLARLREAAPLLRATEGYASRCWHDEAFIDHILLGGPARDWLRPGSLSVFRYRESGPGWAERLSDHCPVSVRLGLP